MNAYVRKYLHTHVPSRITLHSKPRSLDKGSFTQWLKANSSNEEDVIKCFCAKVDINLYPSSRVKKSDKGGICTLLKSYDNGVGCKRAT